MMENSDLRAMQAYLDLQAWWSETASGVKFNATAEATIAELEARYGITLPTDFREYLRCSAPATENWDAEEGHWWPIERIKNIPEEYQYPVSEPIARNAAKHLIFLDYGIWIWAWAISCADDDSYGKIALIGGQPDRYVADGFGDFVSRYTTDWPLCSLPSS